MPAGNGGRAYSSCRIPWRSKWERLSIPGDPNQSGRLSPGQQARKGSMQYAKLEDELLTVIMQYAKHMLPLDIMILSIRKQDGKNE